LKIRILQNFDCYEKGQVFDDWSSGMCDILIRRGLIQEVETAEAEPVAVERADMTTKTAQKKRR
jgi:hypothetical protein